MTAPPRIDKTRLATRFGNRADTYDQVTPVQAEMAKMLVREAGDHFSSHPITRILELGCGTGRMSRELALAFPEAEITALDISADMINFARAREPSIFYIVGDAEAFIQDAENSYDLIISNAAVQWFEDVDKTLTKAYDLLTPQGLLLVSTFGEQTFQELQQAFEYAYTVVDRPKIRHVVAMRTLGEWCRKLPEAKISEHALVRCFPSVRQFLRSVQEAGAVNSMSGRHVLYRDVLREMSRYYTAQFSDLSTGHINATYHALYIKYCKN